MSNDEEKCPLKSLEKEENLQFQYYMMQKILKLHKQTESSFLNNMALTTYWLFIELLSIKGPEEFQADIEVRFPFGQSVLCILDEYFDLIMETEDFSHESPA